MTIVPGAPHVTSRLLASKSPLGRVDLTTTLGLGKDAPATTIAAVLDELRGPRGKMMRSCRVLSLAGLQSFDDACMTALVALLETRPRVFSVNLGEKRGVTHRGWAALVAHLRRGHVICTFVDAVDAASHVRDVKSAVAERRFALEAKAKAAIDRGEIAAAAMLVPWRTGSTWRSVEAFAGSVDLWFAKPFWHPKCRWPALERV